MGSSNAVRCNWAPANMCSPMQGPMFGILTFLLIRNKNRQWDLCLHIQVCRQHIFHRIIKGRRGTIFCLLLHRVIHTLCELFSWLQSLSSCRFVANGFSLERIYLRKPRMKTEMYEPREVAYFDEMNASERKELPVKSGILSFRSIQIKCDQINWIKSLNVVHTTL